MTPTPYLAVEVRREVTTMIGRASYVNHICGNQWPGANIEWSSDPHFQCVETRHYTLAAADDGEGKPDMSILRAFDACSTAYRRG